MKSIVAAPTDALRLATEMLRGLSLCGDQARDPELALAAVRLVAASVLDSYAIPTEQLVAMIEETRAELHTERMRRAL